MSPAAVKNIIGNRAAKQITMEAAKGTAMVRSCGNSPAFTSPTTVSKFVAFVVQAVYLMLQIFFVIAGPCVGFRLQDRYQRQPEERHREVLRQLQARRR